MIISSVISIVKMYNIVGSEGITSSAVIGLILEICFLSAVYTYSTDDKQREDLEKLLHKPAGEVSMKGSTPGFFKYVGIALILIVVLIVVMGFTGLI